jgi:hypothetical protein
MFYIYIYLYTYIYLYICVCVCFLFMVFVSRQWLVDCVWNMMAHAQKPDFVFRRNGRVHLNRRGRQFSRLLAAEGWASAVVMLDTPSSEVVWRVLANTPFASFPFSRASPCAITFKLKSNRVSSYIRPLSHSISDQRTGHIVISRDWPHLRSNDDEP